MKSTDLPTPISGRRKNLAPWILIIIIIVIASLFSVLQYQKNQRLAAALVNLRDNPQKIAALESQQLVNKVSQLIILPAGEEPTVATVSDLAPLADQPFFVNAQVGDKVLIYTQAKKAILYNPASHKIVEVAPLNIGGNPEGQVAGESSRRWISALLIFFLIVFFNSWPGKNGR